MAKTRHAPLKPLPLHEKEYRWSLYRLERRAIIPLKWAVFVVTLGLWVWIIGRPPGPSVFQLFLLYFLFNCAQSYFFYFSRVTINQIKPFVLASYLADVVFVSMLVYLDLATPMFGGSSHHEFYLLYFLLVMRGFALFKTVLETAFVNLMISLLYILTFYRVKNDFGFLQDPNFAVSLLLVWLVILMSWFIMIVVTNQKMEMLEVHDRLLRSDNLARVGELAAGVAHEINNPIGIIATTAEYLKRALPEGNEHLEDIEGIYREAMRCKTIVQDMLTFANPRPIGLTTVEPHQLSDEVLGFVFPPGRSGNFDIVREYEPSAPPFEADPNLIKQALLNIYMNARQAIPKENAGRIIARIFSEHHHERVVLEIEDNGSGIGDEDLEHIFEPFFTRKRAGTGLGLAVTQRIVEIHKGAISVRSAPEQGTVFRLEFPAVKN